MKRWMLVLAGLMLAQLSPADMAWQSDNLITDIPDVTFEDSGGWLVQMYRDVGNDTDLSAITFDLSGNPWNSADERLTSFTSTLTAQDTFGETVFISELDLGYASIGGFHVYTVILDTDSWENATIANRTFVLDATTFFVNDGDPSTSITYDVPNDNPGNHQWQSVIPEPGTLALLGIGLFTMLAIRRYQSQ